jgi:hypothetical protein
MTDEKTDKIDDLTAFEVNQAEKACGVPFELLGQSDEEQPRAGRFALMAALAWVHKKREEPTLTFTDYMKSVKHHEVTDYLFPDEPEAEEGDAGFPDARGAGGPEDAEPGVAAGEEESPVLSSFRTTG